MLGGALAQRVHRFVMGDGEHPRRYFRLTPKPRGMLPYVEHDVARDLFGGLRHAHDAQHKSVEPVLERSEELFERSAIALCRLPEPPGFEFCSSVVWCVHFAVPVRASAARPTPSVFELALRRLSLSDAAGGGSVSRHSGCYVARSAYKVHRHWVQMAYKEARNAMPAQAQVPNWLHKLDNAALTFVRRYGLLCLRLALALVFIWFGALKVAGV